MKQIHETTVVFVLLLASLTALRAADAPKARRDDKRGAFFTSYCTECHGAQKQQGKLRLDERD